MRSRELPLLPFISLWLAAFGLFAAFRAYGTANLGEPFISLGGLFLVFFLLSLAFLAADPPQVQEGGGRRLLLASLGAGLLLAGQYLFWIRGAEKERFFWPGLLLLAGGLCLLLFQGRAWESKPPSRRAEITAFFTLFLLALLARLWRLGEIPTTWWYDEVNLARAIEDRILSAGAAPLYVAENVENPGAYLWVGAAVFKAFGAEVETLRRLAAFYGLLSLFPFYFLARRMLGPAFGLAALALFCCMRWTLIPQRMAFMSGFALFWTLCAFSLYWRCLSSRRLLDFALLGIALGATLHTYTPTRLVLPLLLLFSLFNLFNLGRFRGTKPRHWAALLGAYALVAGPMIAWILGHWKTYTYRSSQVSIMKDIKDKGWSELWVSFKAHLLMFNFRGDHQSRHNLHFWPQLDFLSAALFAPGLALVHWKAFKDFRAGFLALWFWVMLSAGIFSMTVEAPQGHRTILVAPMCALASAYALKRLGGGLASAFSGGLPRPLLAGGLALLLAVPAFNFYELSAVWARHPATWRSFSPESSLAAKRAMRAPAESVIYSSMLEKEYQFNGYERNAYLSYFLRKQNRSFRRLLLSNPVPPELGAGGSVLLIWGESDREITDKFKAQFPGIPLEEAQDPHDAKFDYLAALIPAESLLALPKGIRPGALFYRP